MAEFTDTINLMAHDRTDLKEIDGKLIFGDNERATARSVVIEFSEPINYRALLQLLVENKEALLAEGHLAVQATGSDEPIFCPPKEEAE